MGIYLISQALGADEISRSLQFQFIPKEFSGDEKGALSRPGHPSASAQSNDETQYMTSGFSDFKWHMGGAKYDLD